MTNPYSGSGGPPPFSPSSSTHRRPSYATVASGAATVHPSSLGALGRSASRAESAAARGEQQPQVVRTEQPTHHARASMDVDGVQEGHAAGRRQTNGVSSWGGDRWGCPLHEQHSAFFTPSYLRQSRHVQRLRRAWDEHVAEIREAAAAQSSPPKPPSLSTHSSNANLSKMHASHIHRPAVQDVVERLAPPSDEDRSHPLPSRWSEEDKMNGLEVLGDDRTEVRFGGVTKQSDDAASIRSDHPMPKECGMYYYEVTIMSRGKDGLIGVGFSAKKANLNRLPGWETESWAYHGDDGYSFACTASGKAYGPRFSSADVVGCGVNFRTGNAFFTKNGVYLGVAFTGIKGDRLYPSVGMKKPGEHLRVNFGRHPFVFDIDKIMEQERQTVMEDIRKADLSALHPPDDEDTLIHKLIAQYLAHEGYVDTAKAFGQDVQDRQQALASTLQETSQPLPSLSADDDIHAVNRQKIRKAILDGDIDRALKFMSAYYPHVLEDERNRDVNFRLRCRKFIEMMRRYTELVTAGPTSLPAVTKSLDPLRGSSNGYAEEPADTQMELDDQLYREATPRGSLDRAEHDVDMDASQELPPRALPSSSSSSAKQHESRLLEQAAIAYGQELRQAFGRDTRPSMKKTLHDMFAIIAYPNPTESPIGALLEPAGRVRIAEEVNGSILVSLGKPPSAALEKLCAQTEAFLDETAAKTGGAPAFVDVRRDFLSP